MPLNRFTKQSSLTFELVLLVSFLLVVAISVVTVLVPEIRNDKAADSTTERLKPSQKKSD